MREYEDLGPPRGDRAWEGEEVDLGPDAIQVARVKDPPFERMVALVWRDPLYLVGYGTTLGDSGEIEGD